MKLKSLITASLLSTHVMAAEQTVDVDVNAEEGQAHVMIVKNDNGDVSKISETIDLSEGTDLQKKIDELMVAHGIELGEDGAKVTKKVMVLDGAEVSTTGDHKMMWVQKSNDVNVDIENGVAKVFIKKDDDGEVEIIEETFDVSDDVDLDQLIDDLMLKHGIDAADGEVHKKIIKLDKRVTSLEHNKPRLGFMASVEEGGWKVISVVDGSGADVAGLQAGDLITAIDGEATKQGGLGLNQFTKRDMNEGDVSVVTIDRDGDVMDLDVEARLVDSPDILKNNVHQWISKDGQIVIENIMEGLPEGFGDHEVHVMTAGDTDTYFFSGGKMNQWLGKQHHFSTVTKELGKYFGVEAGVLVLEVDVDNRLGLKDGDVIQAINGEVVNSPKDVVKKLSSLEEGSQVEIEIYRDKEKLYLES